MTGERTLGSVLLKAAAEHSGAALRGRSAGFWRDTSYGEVAAAVEEIALYGLYAARDGTVE